MKAYLYKLTAVGMFTVATIHSGLSQGFFRNLDFEEATIIPLEGHPNYPHAVEVAYALLGWTAYIGGSEQSVILYDDISLGAAMISIHDANGYAVLDGSYTVLLQPSFPSGSILPSIAQVGLIPSTAVSVRFYSSSDGVFNVLFAGHAIPILRLDSTDGYTIYGGDVSAFAGQTGELRFQGGGLLDAVQFSTLPIPEPSTLCFSILAALLFSWRAASRRP